MKTKSRILAIVMALLMIATMLPVSAFAEGEATPSAGEAPAQTQMQGDLTEEQPSPTSYTLTLKAEPDEGGTVEGGGSYGAGTEVTVTATAKDGYVFTAWYEDAEERGDEDKRSEDAEYTFTLNGDLTLSAVFTQQPQADEQTAATPTDAAPGENTDDEFGDTGDGATGGKQEAPAAPTFTVTFDANGHGTAPEAVTADKDGTVTEPFAPSEDGYTFTGWYKDADAAEQWDFAADKVTENMTLYAGWTEEAPTAMRGGSATKSAGTYTIEYRDFSDWYKWYPPDGDYMTGHWPENTTAKAGEVVSLPPIIPGPYPIKKLYGEGYDAYTWVWFWVVPKGYTDSAKDNILDHSTGTFVMPESDVIVLGAWEYGESIQIWPKNTEGGKADCDGRNNSYAVYSWATLTATPNKGLQFAGWKLGDENGPTSSIVSTSNPWKFQITYDKRYTRYYPVFTIRPPGKITVVNGTADQTKAYEGMTVEITADDPPARDDFNHWVFDKWVAETAEPATVRFADENSPTTTFEMPGPDVTITATYVKACKIWADSDPEGCPVTGGGEYKVGETVTLTAPSWDGYKFIGWWGYELDSYSKTYSFTAERDRQFTAWYEKLPTITVQESEGGKGSANRSYADAGQNVTLKATQNASWRFDYWEVVSGDVTIADPSSAETTLTLVSNKEDVVVKPHFYYVGVVIPVATVTYKVVGGTWSDGSTGDKIEYAMIGFKPFEVPTDMKPAEGFEGGAWDTDPANVTITGDTTFTYTFTAKQPPTPVTKHTVTYVVLNGTWADGSKTNKTEEVEDDKSPTQIPSGMIAAENYEGGAWSPDPNGATITGDTTFTYTFDVKNLDVVGIVNWDGDDNQQGKRPEKITVHLLANNRVRDSQEVKAGEGGLWTFRFDNLPAADAQGDIDYTITVDEIPEYTTKVEKKSDTLFVITNTLNGGSDKPGYTVTFDVNVPANASTTCTGSMDDQSFGYYENKPLSTNGYSLPGYDFAGWNTKADGTGADYFDGEPVASLSEDGGTVTLYAQWNAKSYEIFFNPGEIGGYVHSQRAYFDQPDTLEVYSDEAFGWDPGGKVLHGWAGTGYTTFYDDGASFVNLCGDPLPDGSLADKALDAQWVQGGQIIVAVTKDGVPQKDLKDAFSLIDGEGTKFSVEITYKNGKYIFDTSLASAPGIGRAPLPEGEYTLRFSFSDPSYSFIIYPEASAKIAYGADSAVNVVFDYYTVDLQKDPVYTVPHNITIDGAYGISVSGFLVLGGTKLTIRTTVLDPGYIFDRYTADGVAPIWENGDPTKAEQTIKIRGKTTITAHIMPRPKLTVTVIDRTYTYNGGLQGPGDKIYASQDEIAQVVRAEGLRPGDYIASIILDGQGKDVGTYPLSYGFLFNVKNSDGDNVKSDYDIEFVDGTMTIEPAELTVTTGSASKVYDGSPLTEELASIEGLIDNTATAQQGGGVVIVETAAIKATGTQTNAGNSQNTYEIDWGETKASNYKITEKLGTLTVNPKPVTVTANDASKTYGEDDPDLTATPEGLIGSDTVSYTLSRETGENVGTYVITPTGEASQGNYTVSFAPGTFTIEKAPLTLHLSIEGWTEGETANAPVLTGNTGNGAVTYEYKLKTADEAAYGTTVPTAAGDYTVRATVEETANYLSGETTADFTIGAAPAPVTITYEAKDSSGNTVQAVTWQKGSGKTIDLTIKRSEDDHLTYDLFGSLEIGGVTVGSANYDTAKGSLKLSIKPEYLETLSVGDHTVKVNFQDGSATVKLTVIAKSQDNTGANTGTNRNTGKNTTKAATTSGKATTIAPKTGDESNMLLWFLLICASLFVMSRITSLRNRRFYDR